MFTARAETRPNKGTTSRAALSSDLRSALSHGPHGQWSVCPPAGSRGRLAVIRVTEVQVIIFMQQRRNE